MSDGERLLKQAIEAIIAELTADIPPAVAPVASFDEQTQEQLTQYTLLACKPYLTRKEVATYLSVSERSITEWAARPEDKNPFPECAAGDSPRYRRDRVDEWAEREAHGRRLKLVS